MSNITDEIYNYLLSNNTLTYELQKITIRDGGDFTNYNSFEINPKLFKKEYLDSRDQLTFLSNLFNKGKKYGNILNIFDNKNQKSTFNMNSISFDGIINLIYYKNVFPSDSNINIMSNYRYTDNSENKGIIYNEKLENIFEDLITNLPNKDSISFITLTDKNQLTNVLTFNNYPINAIIYMNNQFGNFHLTFPVGSNIILIIYKSFVNGIVSFVNPPQITCPPQITTYIFIIVLIIIIFVLLIILFLRKK